MAERFATIDIGTNTTLLLVAERTESGEFQPVSERAEVTRLGRGVDATGLLGEPGLSTTLDAVRRYVEEAKSLGARVVSATATSAARDAKNGHLLLDGVRAAGAEIEIIGGDREAELSWKAVARDFAAAGRPLAIVDIGGGSTEIVLGTGDAPSWRRSFDVGSVRLSERHLRQDPPSRAELDALRSSLSATFSPVPTVASGARVVGIAGTFTTLAAIHLGLTTYDASRVHGLELPFESLETVRDRLETRSLAERRTIPGLDPKRADVIVAGAHVAVEALRALGADRVTIGDRGIRWGWLYARFG